MKKFKLKRTVVLMLALMLVLSSSMQTTLAEAAGTSITDSATVKDLQETVYGVIKHEWTNLYTVYNMKVESPGEYTIYGDFVSAKNLTDDIEFHLHEQGVTLVLDDSYESLSFQVENVVRLPGTHTGGVELPFYVRPYIEMDGTAIVATGGESGHAKLVVEVNANDEADPFFTENMVCQVQIPIDTNVFKNIKTDLSGVLIGNSYTYSGMVLPGQSATFVIEGDVEELRLGSITVSMMAYDISDMIEETGFTSGLSDMEKGARELAEGTRELADGMAELSDGVDEISGGAKTIKDSTGSISKGMDAYAEGLNELSQGSSGLTEGAAGLAGGMGHLDEQGAQLMEGFRQIKLGLSGIATGGDQLGALAEGLQSVAVAIEKSPTMSDPEKQQILAGLSEITSSLPQQDYNDLIGSLDIYEQGLSSYIEGVSSLSAGASALSDGAAKYVGGVEALADNFIRLSSGVKSLHGGMATLSDGLNSLSTEVSVMPDGANKIADGQQELYEGIKTFSGVLSDYTEGGSDYKAVSVNSPNNNVEQVQIVLRTDTVTPERPVKEKPDSNMSETIIERFLNLFR